MRRDAPAVFSVARQRIPLASKCQSHGEHTCGLARSCGLVPVNHTLHLRTALVDLYSFPCLTCMLLCAAEC